MVEIERIHVRAAKIIYKLDWSTSSDQVLVEANWNTIKDMNSKCLLCFGYRCSIVMLQNYYYLLLEKVITHMILEVLFNIGAGVLYQTYLYSDKTRIGSILNSFKNDQFHTHLVSLFVKEFSI